MDVELRHLRAFVAVARSRLVHAGGQQLLITQPALSRTIQQLESALQVALLDRSSRHVGLTEVGSEFLRNAERVLADFDGTIASVRRMVTIRLGFSWLLPDPWAQDAVNLYEQSSGNAVTLVRCDDPLDGVRKRRSTSPWFVARSRCPRRSAGCICSTSSGWRSVRSTRPWRPRFAALGRHSAVASRRECQERHHRFVVVASRPGAAAHHRDRELRRVDRIGGRRSGHRGGAGRGDATQHPSRGPVHTPLSVRLRSGSRWYSCPMSGIR